MSNASTVLPSRCTVTSAPERPASFTLKPSYQQVKTQMVTLRRDYTDIVDRLALSRADDAKLQRLRSSIQDIAEFESWTETMIRICDSNNPEELHILFDTAAPRSSLQQTFRGIDPLFDKVLDDETFSETQQQAFRRLCEFHGGGLYDAPGLHEASVRYWELGQGSEWLFSICWGRVSSSHLLIEPFFDCDGKRRGARLPLSLC
jgi:hypothetical protein